MDTPHVAVRTGSLASQARPQRNATESENASRGTGTVSGSFSTDTSSVLALLDAASRQRHLGSGTRSGDVDAEGAHEDGGTSGTGSGTSAGASGAAPGGEAGATTAAFRERFAESAADHDAFHALMRASFGEGYDYAAAETLRQQSLDGDFSWMPEIRVVDQSELTDRSGTQRGETLGAYAESTDTIYISRELLESDPERALEILTEEVGHGLDARLNESDSAGDEGEIFARLSAGESLSEDELEALRAENDSGTIVIDGQEIEVEYGSNPLKAIGDALSAPFKAIAASFDAFVNMLGGIWDLVMEVLNSPLFQKILMIAQFIPIPIVQLVVRVIQIVKALHAVYQGIKHGSMAMVLSGIAGAAAGVAGLGAMVGASAKFIDTATKVAQWANRASRAYAALSQKDFGAALALASEAFSGTDAAPVIEKVRRGYAVGEAVGRGDIVGAVGLGSNLVGDLAGEDGKGAFGTISAHASAFGAAMTAAKAGDYGAAATLLVDGYADDLNLDEDVRGRVVDIATALESANAARALIERGDYTGAVATLLDAAEPFGLDDSARGHLEDAAATVQRVANVVDLIRTGDYGGAIAAGLAIVDDDPSPEASAEVQSLVDLAGGIVALADAAVDGDVSGALGALGKIAGVEAPPEVKASVEGVQDFAETVAAIVDAVDEGRYARAADLAAGLADGVVDESVSRSLRSLSALLQGFGVGVHEEPIAA